MVVGRGKLFTASTLLGKDYIPSALIRWPRMDWLVPLQPNRLSSVSRDRAPGESRKFRLRYVLERARKTHDMGTSIRFRWPCRSLSIWRGAIFDKFRTPWPWPWPWLWEKNYRRVSLIDLYPYTKFYQDRTKKCDLGTEGNDLIKLDIESGFITSFSRNDLMEIRTYCKDSTSGEGSCTTEQSRTLALLITASKFPEMLATVSGQ